MAAPGQLSGVLRPSQNWMDSDFSINQFLPWGGEERERIYCHSVVMFWTTEWIFFLFTKTGTNNQENGRNTRDMNLEIHGIDYL